MLRGILVFGGALLVSGALYLIRLLDLAPIGSVYGDPQLPLLIVVSSLGSVILGFQSINYDLASRALNLGRITTIDLISQAASLCLVIAVAWVTRSIWSYVVGGLFTSSLIVLLSHVWLEGRTARFGWHRDAAAELEPFWQMGLPIIGNRSIWNKRGSASSRCSDNASSAWKFPHRDQHCGGFQIRLLAASLVILRCQR